MKSETTTYGFPKAIYEAASRLIEHDIFQCQTSLVEECFKTEQFSYEDVYNLYDTNDEFHGIFEWWSISEFLADQLRAQGEPVLSNGYGVWWGRTCTGQSIILDGTIQEIIKRVGDNP